ncbi:MAG: PorV/PorQ family protein [Bacteroidota bacterium]|jgi:hypothetical protein
MKTIAILLIMQCVLFGMTFSQSKTGTTVGEFLMIEPSARIAGMGNAGVSLHDETQTAYYNPGAIGHFDTYGVQFTHSLWLASIAYDYAAVSIPLQEWGNLYVSGTALNSGEIDVRTVDQPLGTGERYSVNDVALGLGYGRKVSDRFSVGVELNYIQETIWHSSLNAFALNVGTIYEISPDGLRIGASISNFGTEGQFSGKDLRITYDPNPSMNGSNSALPGEVYTDTYSLPVLFRVGVSYPVKIDNNNQLIVAANAYHPNENTESISLGGEWAFMKTFMIRAGYQNLFEQDSETGLTLGTGLLYDMGGSDLHLDYGWADYGRLQSVQMFTLGITF